MAGAELGPLLGTVKSTSLSGSAAGAPAGGIFGAFRVIGGGRFFPAGTPAVGACRIGTGAGSVAGAVGVATSSCKALKFRFFLMGVAIVLVDDQGLGKRCALYQSQR